MTDSSATQPPGWYYAQGDPPGTQRYWDGSQWVGGPQAAQGSVEASGGGGAAGFQPSGGAGQLADTGVRAVAWLIDVAPYIVITLLTLVINNLAVDMLLNLVAIGWGIFNFVVKQGQSGQTVGKAQQGIKLVADDTGQPVGAGMAFVRWLLQGIAWTLCLVPGIVDILFPFFAEDRKRITDKILNMSVVKA